MMKRKGKHRAVFETIKHTRKIDSDLHTFQNPIMEVGTVIISVMLIITALFSFCIQEIGCAYCIIFTVMTFWIK